MDLQNLSAEIYRLSNHIEDIFVSFSKEFPKLLGENRSSSLDELMSTLETLKNENDLSAKTETNYFGNFGEKYSVLFKDLNSKIENLSHINEQITNITNDSEEMELIALNAMVVSIKSGEKGRAFSCITENLQRLSSDMIKLSGKLTAEESSLINNITGLKDLFQQIMDCQKKIKEINTNQVSKISDCIIRSADPLQEIIQLSQSVYPAIQAAMEGIQLQDIIKQAFNHVVMSLDELVDEDDNDELSQKLETTAFNISLAELAQSVLEDIGGNLHKSYDIFRQKWNAVKEILNQTESRRDTYLLQFFDTTENHENSDSIVSQLESTNEDFQEFSKEFVRFQGSQKSVVSICHSITDKARTMYDVFINLRPVINRLQHVRILQEIEVSKNEAIMTVKDFVTDMDNLILDSTNALDIMQTTIEGFIEEIGDMIGTFSQTIAEDTSKMSEVKTEKATFFSNLQTIEEKITSIMQNFTIYPPEFHQQCQRVTTLLEQLQAVQLDFDNMNEQLEEEIEKLSAKKNGYMNELGLSSYEIKDDRFKNLINQFTITAHKEAAGKIGGFDVEAGSSPGDITFF